MRKTALALAAVATLATTAIGPAEARGGRNAAIGFGIAAGALGAAAATSAYHNGLLRQRLLRSGVWLL